MRRFVAVATIALSWFTASQFARSETAYPSRQIRLIVPQSPGTASDFLARTIAQNISSRVGQPIVVENIAGAGGILGSTSTLHAAADGYTLALVGPSHVSNTLLKKTPPYRLLEDFTAVAKIASMPNVIVASAQGRNRTVADLVKAAADRPGELNFGSVGMGSSSHLAVELFVHTVGIKATHVPYRAQSTLVSDLIGDRVQFYSAPLAAVMPLLLNKQAVALCVGARDRVGLLPETPTMIELGYRDYTSDSWFGLVGPAGLDASIVKRLDTELERTLADSAIRATLASQGALPSYSGPGELIGLQRAELEQTRRILQFIDFKPE